MATALMALAAVTVAAAATHHLKGEFERFGECPLSEKKLTDCVYSVTSSGAITIGVKSVPIKNPVILQGGFKGASDKIQFFGAENGETLSKTPQPVPAGLEGVTAPSSSPKWLQKWFNEGVKKGPTNVSATLELAAPASSIKLNTEHLLFEEGIALGLPVKIRLENALLGPNCHLGSNEKPIQIDFTTGKSGSLKGLAHPPTFNKEYTIDTTSGARLVNDSFAASGASGCGGIFSFFVDPLVDSILHTPSPPGHNTAVLEGDLHDAAAAAARENE